MARRIYARDLLIVAGLVVLAACSRPGSGPAQGSTLQGSQVPAAKPVAAASTTARPWYADRFEKLGFTVFPLPVDVGDFTAESLGGGSSSLAAVRGNIVLLNFWATWCPPCKAEMPSIESLWKKTRKLPFTIMAVSIGEEKATVGKFIGENKYSYPIFLDPANKLGTAFNATAIPTTYILDKEGRAIAGTQGSQEYDRPEFLSLVSELASR
jgi:thiol-disulfide isomerase/thioredoxin